MMLVVPVVFVPYSSWEPQEVKRYASKRFSRRNQWVKECVYVVNSGLDNNRNITDGLLILWQIRSGFEVIYTRRTRGLCVCFTQRRDDVSPGCEVQWLKRSESHEGSGRRGWEQWGSRHRNRKPVCWGHHRDHQPHGVMREREKAESILADQSKIGYFCCSVFFFFPSSSSHTISTHTHTLIEADRRSSIVLCEGNGK